MPLLMMAVFRASRRRINHLPVKALIQPWAYIILAYVIVAHAVVSAHGKPPPSAAAPVVLTKAGTVREAAQAWYAALPSAPKPELTKHGLVAKEIRRWQPRGANHLGPKRKTPHLWHLPYLARSHCSTDTRTAARTASALRRVLTAGRG